MKALLEADITIKQVVINLDSTLDHRDWSTHSVHVKGHVGHAYKLHGDKDIESFSCELTADKEFCEIIEAYLEKKMQLGEYQKFPRHYNATRDMENEEYEEDGG